MRSPVSIRVTVMDAGHRLLIIFGCGPSRRRVGGATSCDCSVIGKGSVMAVRVIEHPCITDREARGADARRRTPLTEHAGWIPGSDRPDPVALLEEQNVTREPDLVPVRHGRMMVSPFTF